jgi:serine/threonine-protein kinase
VSEQRLSIELDGGGRRVELPRAGVLTLGSGRADVVLRGEGVGEAHCVIGRVRGGGWAIKDLGSSGGTRVDGARVESAKLEAGQVLELGSVRLRVVDASAPATPAPPAPTAAARQASALGDVTGYRIERALGRGGMGQVFLAVQESLQRKVALKVLADRLASDADFVRRFQAEARAAAALNHPNIVTVHDVWEERGRHFLAMEFMAGGTLEERVTSAGPLGAKEALEVLSDAAKGLVFAELRGIVHRDIKPANLMRDEVGTTKIADLGLATHLEAEATDEGGGKIYGTPHFIAPEQARGERVDARADLYSLGATAYRLLSGHTPFEGATTREILRGHLLETPRPLSEFVPGVPPSLSQLVSRLLAKKPEERFQSAGALLTELERIKLEVVHGVGAAAAAPSRSGAGSRLLLVALLAGAAAGGWWWFARPAEPARAPTGAGGGAVAHGDPPLDEPAPPGGDEPAAGSAAPPPLDDDSALARLERQAEEAWNGLSQSLDREARRLELERLAREFAGTTAAGRFQREAEDLARQATDEVAAAAQGDARVSEALSVLRAASGGVRAGGDLALELASLAAAPVEESLVADEAWRQGARALWTDAFDAAAERAAAALDALDARAAQGDFDGLAEAAEALRAGLAEDGWPPLPEALALADAPELSRLRDTRARAVALFAGAPTLATRWRLSTERADRAAQAEGLRAGGSFEAELRRLDLSGARARLERLAAELPLADSRAWMSALAEELAAGEQALRALESAWEAGQWRRRTIQDPRQRGRVAREVVDVGSAGLVLKDGEGVETLAWSEFGGRPTELHQLFHERLTRAFDARELSGIAALVRIAAVLQAVEEGSEILEPDDGGVLSDEETRLLQEGFDVAAPWAAAAGRQEALERERAAARVAATALRAASDGRHAASATALERLLVEHRHTLLVRLLSDGGLVEGVDPPLPDAPPQRLPDPPPAAAPVDAAAPEAGAAGDADGGR